MTPASSETQLLGSSVLLVSPVEGPITAWQRGGKCQGHTWEQTWGSGGERAVLKPEGIVVLRKGLCEPECVADGSLGEQRVGRERGT